MLTLWTPRGFVSYSWDLWENSRGTIGLSRVSNPSLRFSSSARWASYAARYATWTARRGAERASRWSSP